jgi:hypothetical protein
MLDLKTSVRAYGNFEVKLLNNINSAKARQRRAPTPER